MKVVWAPHVDYLRVVGRTAAEVDFIRNGHRWWRPGWYAQEKQHAQGHTMTIADAEAAARSWPQPWAASYHVTRVDLACDVVLPPGHRFTMDHRLLFTSRGRRKTEERGHEVVTLYVGSRESPVLLRIYAKSESSKVTERDRSTWKANGWNGRDTVWRVEYELHTKALPHTLALPGDVPTLWADCLARIRMCETPPRLCTQQNKARTHPWWLALGTARRYTRRRTELTKGLMEPRVAQLVAALDRLLVRGGHGTVELFLRRLAKLKS